ncbi:MAG: DUF5916 domain-containing protein, partial [Longimicrobiaceae bacterium]
MHRRPTLLRLALPLCGTLAAGAAAAQQPARPAPTPAAELRTPVLQASRATGGIRVDGRLDDAAWAAAEIASDFVQTRPTPGAPASQRTEVRIVYDDAALYVAARMHDDRPDSIAAPLARRDVASGLYSDWFDVLVDSYHDRRTGFRFAVNPRGVRRDVYHSNDANEDASWDPVYDVATAVDSAGWTAEFRIPLSQLRFPRAAAGAERTWGVNFSRTLARRDEIAFWSELPPNYTGLVSRAGDLRGLVGIGTPRRLEVVPYTSARLTREPGESRDPFFSENEVAGSIGADVKAGLPGGLTLSATINPDFGQVEVDPAIINLSAFETRLEEKRPFFVEGASNFRFAPSVMGMGAATGLLYSRRIGRVPQLGVPTEPSDVPGTTGILGAAKISGKTASGWSLGILEAVTGEESGRYLETGGLRQTAVVEPMTNYFLGRVNREMRQGQSAIGGIFTAVNRDVGAERVDQLLRSSAYTG